MKCLFDTFARARATTKIIESVDEIEGFQSIEEADKKEIINLIKAKSEGKSNAKASKPSAKEVSLAEEKKKAQKRSSTNKKKDSDTESAESEDEDKPVKAKKLKESEKNDSKDNRFETFQIICKKIAEESSHTKKTNILAEFLKDGIEKSKKRLNFT